MCTWPRKNWTSLTGLIGARCVPDPGKTKCVYLTQVKRAVYAECVYLAPVKRVARVYLASVERSFVTKPVTEQLTLLDRDVDVDEDTGEEHAQQDRRRLRHHALVQPKSTLSGYQTVWCVRHHAYKFTRYARSEVNVSLV